MNKKYTKAFFDELHNRQNTLSIKYDMCEDGVLPMWVADMDFETVDEVKQALIGCARQGIYGYSEKDDAYNQAVCNWWNKRHGYAFSSEDFITTPGIVFALSLIIENLTNKGDGIMVMTPIYPPFINHVKNHERKLVTTNLKLIDDHYELDLDDMENKLATNDVKLLMLCSPHNPCAKMWKKEELMTIIALCKKYHVLCVSDEIHADFELFNHKHIPIASLNKEFSQQCITCTSPSKTFNLAGLQVSNIICENEAIRKKLIKGMSLRGSSHLNVMAYHACMNAYQYGEEWLNGLLEYIEGNIKLFQDAFNNDNSLIHLLPMEATYLGWIDCRKLQIDDEALNELFLKDMKIRLNPGASFFEGGKGFMRINLACPRSVVEEAIKRIKKGLKKYYE